MKPSLDIAGTRLGVGFTGGIAGAVFDEAQPAASRHGITNVRRFMSLL
jgi:hypothetical protein